MEKRNFALSFFVIFFISIFLSSVVLAKSEVVYANYKYTMGDNDTKNDAKKIAFIEAKRLCIEKAGTYIESNTEVADFRLSKDEIKTYASGILKVEVVSEEFKLVGESMTLFISVKAEIDLNDVKEKIKRIKGDKKLEAKIKEQEKQLQAMENRIRGLQKRLQSTDFNKTVKVREQRKEVFLKIDELEAVKYEINSRTKMAVENIELAMTPEEVIKLIGRPRSENRYIDDLRYNYGNAWIIIESGVVSCIVKAEFFRNDYYCREYRRYLRGAVIK